MKNRTTIIAVVLLVLLSLLNAASELEMLGQGAGAAGTGSYIWSLFNFLYNILGLVAAFGLFRGQSWGSTLALAVVALNLINYAIGLFSGELPGPVVAITAVFMALYILIAVLVLRKPSPAGSGS